MDKMYALTTWIVLVYCTIYTTVHALDSEQHTCGSVHGNRVRRHDHEQYPRHPPKGNKYGYAMQFETGQVIQYSKRGIASRKFSVDFWMKVEGGQQNPAIILHAYEKCAPKNESRGWFIGLHEAGLTRDLRVIYTVHSASADSNKTIISHSKIEAKRWYHVAATYDGTRMKLYVNQAKVAVGYGQKGMLFDAPNCVVLEVGGDVKRGLFYRGTIDKLRLWNEPISHQTITQSLPENGINSVMDKISMYDDFNNNDMKSINWIPVSYQYPKFVRSTVPDDKHDLSIRKPPCGKTICDNPEVVRSYLKHPRSRGMKRLRIRFINIMNDDGGQAILSDSDIKSQFHLMQTAFSRYNISWELKVEEIRNSYLRSKTILHGFECREKRKDDVRLMCIDDYKKRIGITNRDGLNVFVVNLNDENTQGMAVFPWEKSLHTVFGGVFLPPKNFATTTVLIHEIGHVLGLWHVHYGNQLSCTHECFESFPSLELGDLCSDTNPTVENRECKDPVGKEKCGMPQYKNTPYNNYMSYANDSCTDHFTPQQVARMHCYIDLDYQSWQKNAQPSFVPLSPRIIEAKKDRITLSWLPPLGPGGNNAINLCNECDDKHMLEQYATTARSSIPTLRDRARAPHKALGPPDAEYCVPTGFSWQVGDDIVHCPNCPLYLEVGFKHAVVPNEIEIWVPSFEDSPPLSDIVLMYVDGSKESIGNGTAQCDSPFTKPLYVKQKVDRVRIYVSDANVCIDAVKLTSGNGHPNCSKCNPLRYIIRREPPFDTGHEITVPIARFVDKNIDVNGRYKYKVKAMTNEGETSPFSPTLTYEPMRGFCGDGKIDKGEDCDDGNVRDGDGCNIQCQMEDVFWCDGRPSLCYRHDGDGKCEEFEKTTSIQDCGFYTPDGFKDQWVDHAVTNSKYEYTCKIDHIIGPPRADLKCEYVDYMDMNCVDGWTPLTDEYKHGKNHWTKIYFKKPAIASALVVYLAAIVSSPLDPSPPPPPMIKFELHGATSDEKTTQDYQVTKYCKENPITIPIHHDMTKPFFKTHYIKMKFSEDVKIAAVSLRSPKYFDPVELQKCTGSKLFHPSTQKCNEYECKMPKCLKLMLKHATQIKECKKGSVEGDTCTVQCNRGFTPVAPFEIICSNREWLVDGAAPQCTPVDCGEPKIKNAVISCPEGNTFGKQCMYKCMEGTKQFGTGEALTVTCEADGTWSAITIFCRRSCPPPPIPLHAKPLTLARNCNKIKPFAPGDTCKYRCKQGYRPSGLYIKEVSSKGHFVQRCLKGGEWTKKRCIQVTCPVDDPMIFRWYNCTLGSSLGSVCRLACPGEEVREVKCGSEGNWDKTFQFCSTKGSCPKPVDKNGKIMAVSCGEHHRPGEECEIKCGENLIPVFEHKGGSKKEVKSIMCSPFFQWYPHLNKIKCTPKCEPADMHNGFCDGHNNNEECQYDGGDCCDPSTMKAESLCGDCECKDITSPDYGKMVSSGDDRISR